VASGDASAAFAPRWLDASATPLLHAIGDAYTASIGRSRRHLAIRLAQVERGRLDDAAFTAAVSAVDAWHDDIAGDGLVPRDVRRVLFAEGARGGSRIAARERAAATLGCSVAQLDQGLFADLPPERLLRRRAELPAASALILAANQLLFEAALVQSDRLELALSGGARALVQAIRATRLIALVHERAAGTLNLSVSGPLALHSETRLYGRALCRFMLSVQRAERWSLCARRTSSAGHSEVLVVDHRDPLPKPPGGPDRFDSKVELALYDGLLRHGGAWQVTREPAPLRAGDSWFFPDFLATHADTDVAIWIELVGFWTPAYVARKRELMSRSFGHPVLYLVDETLGLDTKALAADAEVLLFRRRCAAKAVVAALDRLAERLAPRAGEALE
jgi:predicted nuclease of restriction endonuclease-like RecB superfamily